MAPWLKDDIDQLWAEIIGGETSYFCKPDDDKDFDEWMKKRAELERKIRACKPKALNPNY